MQDIVSLAKLTGNNKLEIIAKKAFKEVLNEWEKTIEKGAKSGFVD